MYYYNSRVVWLIFVLIPICSSYLNANILPQHLMYRQKRQQQPDDDSSSSNVLVTQPTDQGNQDLAIEMCDVENSNNSFIYCSGRILAAAMAHYFPYPTAMTQKHLWTNHSNMMPENCVLNEWKESPPLLELIKDDALREWAMDLNVVWKNLCRQMKPDVEAHPDRYSLLYVPRRFVVPGGRYREFYYWDTYWTIKGLLVSGMHEICKT
uniref:Trehalase n=1 Tax=Ditylenchus dipsaci TaxID=166011 RepID=A0A915CMD9_9BILA